MERFPPQPSATAQESPPIIHAGARIQPDTQGGTGLFNAGGKFIRKRLAHAAH